MVYLGLVSSTDETPRPAQHETGRLEFETLISDLSSRFINLPPEEVHGEIEDTQRRVCEVLGIDLSALWEGPAATGGPLTLTHFYSSQEGLLPPMRGMSAAEYFPWLQQEMLDGRTVAAAALDELPEPAALDRDNLRLFGVKSNLTVPLTVGGTSPIGALGFNTTREERDWPEALVKRLQLVAQVFANALARKRADELLQESQARLAMAADAAGAGLWSLDYRTGIFWVTDRTRAIFGFSPDEVVTMKRFEACVHPLHLDLVRGTIERSAQAPDEPLYAEYRILSSDGSTRWVASRGRPRSTSGGPPDRLMGVTIDISEHVRAQEELSASQARLEAGVELADLGFYELDYDEGTAHADDRFRDLVGVPPDCGSDLRILESWMERLHPDDRQTLLDARERLRDGSLDLLSIQYRLLHPTRGQRWVKHVARVAARDAAGRRTKVYGVLRDVTERNLVEEDLHELSRRLIGAHEEERALLARELHDDVTQRLAVLAIDVGRAELATPDPAQVETMRTVRAGLVRLSEDIHSLAYQLHPSVLEELGLAEALRAECERRERQGRLALALDVEPLPADLGTDAALCLFRVAQEALNNVARHAGVRAASVTLRPMDGGLLLAVSDAGAGFDPESPKEGMHLGLASMRERVRLVHGTLDIESVPGQGTTVLAWVPAEEASR
jgi:PAS domain S-box-containing protein